MDAPITQATQVIGATASAEILISNHECMIVVSNLADQGKSEERLFDDSRGRLCRPFDQLKPAMYGTNGQVIRGMAFNNKDLMLLVFDHETNGTIGIVFRRDSETN
jgi:hypothetical protein